MLGRSNPIASSRFYLAITLLLLLTWAACPAAGDPSPNSSHGTDTGGEEGPGELGKSLPLWSVIPFAGILLSIALFPLVRPHFWHRHFPKVSAFWALLFAIPFVIAFGHLGIHEIAHVYFIDYIPFIILLWALFTISGGILVEGSMRGNPVTNVIMLLIGTAVASWIGTTGASMLMIRPVLRANACRKNKTHIVVFFIFLVSNIGGSLTPLGDPPLFLGFLHGVPFFWTFKLFPMMGLVAVVLLGVFFLFDSAMYRREQPSALDASCEAEPLRILGLHNFLLLGGVVGSVLMSGFWHPGHIELLGVHVEIQDMVRDGAMVALGLISLRVTPHVIRERNEFSWFPIKEVAYLFAGIFMTIIPAIAILQAGTEGSLGKLTEAVRSPVHYFWATGALSSFLDNAPTYLTFLNSALGTFCTGLEDEAGVALLIKENEVFLKAISAGAVFMGANTYIGNAPNFMVKCIAEEAGIPMPSFFGFIIRYSAPILLPLFAVVTLVFLT